ncbi:TOPRS ligase, partial [Pygoscelis papua]
MAMEPEWTCPICHDARNDVAYLMPCLHQFCLGCILRWTRRKPQCALCRTPIEIVRFSVQAEDDYLQYVIPPLEESPDASSQAGRAPGHPADNSPHHPVASPPSSPQRMLSPAEQGAAGTDAEATVGGLLPEVWAALFQGQEHLLDPVLPWLRQELVAICGARWWQAKNAENSILRTLCIYGPDGEVMVQVLQDCLQEYTAPLVHGVIDIIVRQCSEEARRLLRSYAAGEEDDSPAASSSSSSCTSSQGGNPDFKLASSSRRGSNGEDQLSTLEAAPCGGPGHPPSAPTSAEQEQPQQEPGEAAVAGPSAQGCSRSPCAPGRGRDRLPRGARRPPKRRAPSPQDSPQPCKRPPRRRH